MPLEIILGVLIAAAVLVFVVVVAAANKETVPVEKAVAVKSLKEFEAPVIAVTPKVEPPPGLPVLTQELQDEINHAKEVMAANDVLREDNAAVKQELMAMTERYRDLLNKYQEQEDRYAAEVASLIKEKEIIAQQAVEHSKLNQDQLTQEVEDLRRTQEKLKELNNTLSIKADMLQYELIKSRAQATGFERISQNYRQQLEELTQQGMALTTHNRLEALALSKNQGV